MKTMTAIAAGVVLVAAASKDGSNREEEGWRAFSEVATVLTHPRCLNCHVPGESPGQGASLAAHDPPVLRGQESRV